jgi:hypothetical protein
MTDRVAPNQGEVMIRCLSLAAAFGLFACSIFRPEAPDLSISVQPEVSVPSSTAFHVTVGGRNFELQLGPERIRYAIKSHAPQTGELPVSVALRSPTNTTVAEAAFNQVYEEGSNHWVAGNIGTRRPIGHCIGTLLAVPITPPITAGGDTLFIMYGSIPKDAIC